MFVFQGVEKGIQVIVLRLPVFVYEESSYVSYTVNVYVEAAKKRSTVSYIGSGIVPEAYLLQGDMESE